MNAHRNHSQRRRRQPTAISSMKAKEEISCCSRPRHYFSILPFIATQQFILATILFNIVIQFPREARAFSLPSSGGPSSSSSSPQPPPPPFPNPSTPEEAVQNQLFHYQHGDLRRAYECCSPSNREATGSLSEFERLVREAPYDLIAGHDRADVLMEVIPDGQHVPDGENGILDMSCCLVCIRPNRENARTTHPVWFWWEMSLYGFDNDDDVIIMGGDAKPNDGGVGWKGCRWMVECIMPDFDDLDFETESLSIENFGGEEGDEDEDEDEITIYWDFDE